MQFSLFYMIFLWYDSMTNRMQWFSFSSSFQNFIGPSPYKSIIVCDFHRSKENKHDKSINKNE